MALTLCAESTDVLVVEYEPRWLPALTLLRQKQPGAPRGGGAPARPGGRGAVARTAPIDAVPWDGQALSVLPAIERAIGGSSARAATSPVVAVVQTLVSRPPGPRPAPLRLG